MIFFAAYFVTAKVGLTIKPSAGGFATFVWPPTGIALFLLIGNLRLWPAVMLASFAVNFSTGAPVLVALGIAAGNTLEALFGAYTLNRLINFDSRMQRLRDVLGLIALAGIISTLIGATIGVLSLWAGGLIEVSGLNEAWQTWWLGDAIGATIVGPVLMTWLTRPAGSLSRRRMGEAAALALSVVILSFYVFSGLLGDMKTFMPPFPFLLFPLIIWSALRFGQRGATAAVLFISGMAIWGTFDGHGLAADRPPLHQIHFLYCYLTTISLTGMVVAATDAEKRLAARELLAAKDSAEAANRAKSNFLANMSHEIRTPLGAVIGFSELMTDPEVDRDKRDQYSSAIKRNGELLSSIIGDILDFSKVEAGRTEIFLRPVRLEELVNDARHLLEPMAGEKGLNLKIVKGRDLPEVINTDPLRLKQILVNIAGNAIKFTSQGSIEIRIEWAVGGSNLLAFMIKDTGPGIRQDQKSKLFQPFSQVDSSDARSHGGSGLGLVLSRHFAHMLGGDVVLDKSEPGRGSTFAITIDPGST